jgi:hypothetical protein
MLGTEVCKEKVYFGFVVFQVFSLKTINPESVFFSLSALSWRVTLGSFGIGSQIDSYEESGCSQLNIMELGDSPHTTVLTAVRLFSPSPNRSYSVLAVFNRQPKTSSDEFTDYTRKKGSHRGNRAASPSVHGTNSHGNRSECLKKYRMMRTQAWDKYTRM